MYVKSACILAGLALFWYAAFFGFPGSFKVRRKQTVLRKTRLRVAALSRSLTARASLPSQASLLAAMLLGAMKAEVGVSIMHDANHGAYGNSGFFCRVMGATLDLAGASSFMWRQQHVVGHHAFTNVDGLDPDIRVSGSDVRRVTARQPWHPWHAVQHLYLGVLYSLLAVKSIYVDDFAALAEGHIGAVSLAPRTRAEAAVLFGGKALYATYMLAAPLLYSHHTLGRLLVLWAACDAVTGLMLAYMFQVAHVVDDVAYPVRDPATGRVALGWAEAQMKTTADFCHGSWFWTHVSGGLNYQVRRHMCADDVALHLLHAPPLTQLHPPAAPAC